MCPLRAGRAPRTSGTPWRGAAARLAFDCSTSGRPSGWRHWRLR
jgi:hypothetical protein